MKSISTVAINTKRFIESGGYKQVAIAKKAGYGEQQFSDMLNGRKTIKDTDILPIAKALGVTPNDLFATEQTA
jgi:transcriptional regulator with XRE-family HTH domain